MGLLFSEYLEGSSNNKAVEIFNGTGATVDLSQVKVLVFSNGSATVTGTISLSGTLAAGAVFVVCNSGGTIYPSGVCGLSTGSLNFNGNDGLQLTFAGAMVDRFGDANPPSSGYWGTGSVTSKDHTLRRKCSITQGDTDYSVPFDPAVEWDAFGIDDVSGLGVACTGGSSSTSASSGGSASSSTSSTSSSSGSTGGSTSSTSGSTGTSGSSSTSSSSGSGSSSGTTGGACVPDCGGQRCSGDDGCGHPCPACVVGACGATAPELCGTPVAGDYPGLSTVPVASGVGAFVVSADQQHVAYFDGANQQLAVATLSGGNWTGVVLTAHGDPHVEFSADSQFLIFQDKTSGTNWPLYVARADGSSPVQVVNNGAYSWSVGGHGLAYFINEDMGDGNYERLYVSSLDAPGTSTYVGPFANNNASPHVSFNPGGSAFLFETYTLNLNGAFLMRPDGSIIKNLEPSSGTQFFIPEQWAPDGSSLLFVLDTNNSQGNSYYVVQADGGGETYLAFDGFGTNTFWRGYLPDSTVAFVNKADGDPGTYSNLQLGAGPGAPTIESPILPGDDFDLVTASADSQVLAVSLLGDLLMFPDGGYTYPRHLLAAPRSATTFTPLASGLTDRRSVALDEHGSHVAAVLYTSTGSLMTGVFPTAGGAPAVLDTQAIRAPLYEPGAPYQLLLEDSVDGNSGVLQLYAQDGSGPPVLLPGAVAPLYDGGAAWGWVSHQVLYKSGSDLVLADDDGLTLGAMAHGALQWQVVPGSGGPARLFYTAVEPDGGAALSAIDFPRP